ncbi:MAG TPA: ABC transporter permease [Opitutus sp.]|nr:ABC transporter permease [Opitutus sp.]
MLSDFRSAFRQLLKSPGFTAITVLTLALGVGACTALFSVFDATLLRPLPFPQPDRLALIWETNPSQGVKREGPSGPNFYDWREQNRSFHDMAAFELGSGTVTGLGEPRQVPAMRVTANFFSVLNVGPKLGRLFTPEDGRGGRQPLVIVSHGFWHRALGADPHIVGRTFSVDQISYTVLGVLTPEFALPFQSELFVPWPDDELRFERGRLAHDLGVIGRLNGGVTSLQAESELNAIADRLRTAHPELTHWGVTVVPLQTVASEYLRPALVALACAVAVVLLIACANVANLLLARGVGRVRDLSVRAALGASRWRLVRQCLAESIALGLAGGALGTLLAAWGVSLLALIVPAAVPVPDAGAEVAVPGFGIDGRALAFTFAVSLLTSALFGVAPAAQAFRTDLSESLKKTSRTASGAGRRAREALLTGEVALALVLLAAAGFTLQSFRRLERADLGFRADRLLTLEIELPTDSRYRTGPEQSAFFQRVLERAATLPGVTSAAVTSILPLHPQEDRARFVIENGPALPANETLQAHLRRVSPEYFSTMGIALRRGRLFDLRDGGDPGAPLTGVIDEAFARRFFGEQNPLGRHLRLGRTRLEIVGVVGAVKHAGARRDASPTLYASFLQVPAERMNLVLRTAGDPSALASAAKKAVWSIDRDQPVYRVESMESVVAQSASALRLMLSLLAVFSAVALGLAASGIYGVMAYSVAQRTNEIGLRMALGAQPGAVLAHVLRQGMRTVAVGLALGLGATLALGRLAQSVLYATSPHDPLVLLSIATLLAAVAFVACWFPARRATKVDPLTALRAE